MFEAYESKENKQIAKYQIMDKIHGFFYHQNLTNVEANSNRMNKKYTQLYNMKDMFTSGWEFNYVDKQTQKNKKSNVINITAKYKNIKEELISNDIFQLTLEQYNNEVIKAQYHWNICVREQFSSILKQHILSLM
eukprot:214159_1